MHAFSALWVFFEEIIFCVVSKIKIAANACTNRMSKLGFIITILKRVRIIKKC